MSHRAIEVNVSEMEEATKRIVHSSIDYDNKWIEKMPCRSSCHVCGLLYDYDDDDVHRFESGRQRVRIVGLLYSLINKHSCCFSVMKYETTVGTLRWT